MPLVYDNRDDKTGALSIDSIFTSAGVFKFVPQKTGLINRAWVTVKPGNTLYCHQPTTVADTKFLIQLVDMKTLKIDRPALALSHMRSYDQPSTSDNR